MSLIDNILLALGFQIPGQMNSFMNKTKIGLFTSILGSAFAAGIGILLNYLFNKFRDYRFRRNFRVFFR